MTILQDVTLFITDKPALLNMQQSFNIMLQLIYIKAFIAGKNSTNYFEGVIFHQSK